MEEAAGISETCTRRSNPADSHLGTNMFLIALMMEEVAQLKRRSVSIRIRGPTFQKIAACGYIVSWYARHFNAFRLAAGNFPCNAPSIFSVHTWKCPIYVSRFVALVLVAHIAAGRWP
jgi:hypothetical protein